MMHPHFAQYLVWRTISTQNFKKIWQFWAC